MLGSVSNLGRVKNGKYQGMQSRLVVLECLDRVVQFSVVLIDIWKLFVLEDKM